MVGRVVHVAVKGLYHRVKQEESISSFSRNKTVYGQMSLGLVLIQRHKGPWTPFPLILYPSKHITHVIYIDINLLSG